jgi:Sulfotransferase domain
MNIKKQIFRIWRKGTSRIRLQRLTKRADAFLASYPKSGRTWFRFILSNYFAKRAKHQSDVTLHSMFKIIPNFALDKERGVGALDGNVAQAGLPLVLVTHHRYQKRYFGAKPVIFLMRDPRDVLISSYFHATKHKHRFEGSIRSFLFDPEQGLPDFVNYLNDWANNLGDVPHVLLTYEKLQDDAASETARVLKFLNVEIDEELLREAVAASRFEAMRDLEKVEGIPDHDYDRNDRDSMRMRRGKSGGYLDYLSNDDIAAVETYLLRNLSPAAKQLLNETGIKLHGEY